MAGIFRNWRVTAYGVLSWLVPFAVAIPFFSPETGLVIPLLLFKQIMLVTGSLVGVGLLVLVFRSVTPRLSSGLAIGLYWLALNWLLDILILVPMSGDDIPTWFTSIGLGYFSILFIATGMGLVAERAGGGLK